jgi:outer membrane protein assembly factor BamB
VGLFPVAHVTPLPTITMRTRLLLPALFLCTSLAAAGDSWPGFRGPGGDGRSDSASLPTTWSETENIRWKTAIHGKAWSSPVVLGDQVWVTTADERLADKVPSAGKGGAPPNPVEEVTFFAVCVDRSSGKVIHDVKLGRVENPDYCIPFNSYASSTPFIEKGRLYAHFGSNGTWCVDTSTGKTLWARRDLKCNHWRGAASSAVVYDNLLYLIFDGFDLQYVAALDKMTGQIVWKTDRDIQYKTDNGDFKKAYATPALFEIGGKPQLICPSAQCTIAYDPKTGTELWRISHDGMNGAARPVRGNDLLYLTSGHNATLLAVKPSGTGMLPKSAVAWQVEKKAVPTRPSLLLDGELLYMVSDNGIASCLDALTGKVYWAERLDGEFSASPILAGKNIYCFNQTGKTFVLATGKTFNVIAENRLDGGFMASPAEAGNELFLRTKTHLYRVGKK